MSQFSSHYRLASWAGLAPGCNESAGKKKSAKISKAGVYLKPALVEVAHCAVKDKIKFTKNNFMQPTKQLLSLGLIIDELQEFIISKISESTPII